MSSRKRCCIKNCIGFGRSHKFPQKDCLKYRVWLQNCIRSIERIESVTRPTICSRHFLPVYFGASRKRLKHYAVPTLYLDIPDPDPDDTLLGPSTSSAAAAAAAARPPPTTTNHHGAMEASVHNTPIVDSTLNPVIPLAFVNQTVNANELMVQLQRNRAYFVPIVLNTSLSSMFIQLGLSNQQQRESSAATVTVANLNCLITQPPNIHALLIQQYHLQRHYQYQQYCLANQYFYRQLELQFSHQIQLTAQQHYFQLRQQQGEHQHLSISGFDHTIAYVPSTVQIAPLATQTTQQVQQQQQQQLQLQQQYYLLQLSGQSSVSTLSPQQQALLQAQLPFLQHQQKHWPQ